MTEEQRNQIGAVMAAEHVAYITTLGDEWPTATLEAFAETPELNIVMVMGEQSDRFQNVAKRPNVSFLIANRYGEVSKFQITRLSGRGVASEVSRDSDDWSKLKGIFLEKNPFEEMFFGNPGLKMVRIRPKTMKYADALNRPFVVEF